MAEQRGALGAVFKGAAAIYSKNLVFAAADSSVSNSDSLFVTSGFVDDQKVRIYGSTSNNGAQLIHSVAAGKIVFEGSVVNETPASAVLIYSDAPGTQMTGFYQWSLDSKIDLLKATDFADAGVNTYIVGDAGWTATAQAHWMTDEDVEQYIGAELFVRFFVKYSAAPSAPAPVYLYEGLSLVTGISVDCKVGDLVQRPLTFSGIGPIIYRALTAYA
jgi:hypothetical protein